MKSIVVYFSCTDTTKKLSEKLAEITHSDLFEIEPEQKYTSQDLNWHDKSSRSSIEMKDVMARPKMLTTINTEPYDLIYIGFPIWWYEAPRIINTFIEQTNLENKKIILFATSGGSSIDSSLKELKKQYPSLSIVNGKVLTNSYVNISDWLKTLL